MAVFPSHILIVDGEPALRDRVERLLEEVGFTVTAAPDGEAALRVVEREPINLAIVATCASGTDDGRDIVRRARTRQPDMKALFVSPPTCLPVWDDPDKEDFLPQTFQERELLGCVFEILFRHPA
jgi:response regulator RpfG family c-di-GMP phosphodiesterase